MKSATILFLLALYPFFSFSQPVTVSGTVKGGLSGEPLTGANITLYSAADTTLIQGVSSAADGSFVFRNVRPDDYILVASFLGYRSFSRNLEVRDEAIIDMEIVLEPGSLLMEDLLVIANRAQVEVRGDTTQFNAESFLVNPDATAEDLILRMPGFTIVDGVLQAQGEEVERVLVDGDEFFGDDARIALRNLPAEIIAQIELYERQSDQARFTGFDDDDAENTVNIVTRPGMRTGRFGRGEGGFGTDTRYMTGGNLNFFDGSRRISLIGLSNNINQLNFSTEDMEAISQGQGGRGGRGGRGMRGQRGGGIPGNFRMGNQSGINTVHSLGVNYIDRRGENLRLNGNYFFNATSNTNEVELERRYIMARLENQIYDETSISDSDRYNHRMDMRAEYDINDDNSLVFRTNLGAQSNSDNAFLEGFTLAPDRTLMNEIMNESVNDNVGLDFSQSLLYRRQLGREGRTLSADFRGNVNRSTGDRYLMGETWFADGDPEVNDQLTDIFSNRSGLSANFAYTEPLGEDSQLMLRWNPSWSRDRSDRETLLYDEPGGGYHNLDTLLSNRYENDLYRQRGGARLRTNTDRLSATLELDYQYSLLRGDQDFPIQADTRQVYHNLLPGAGLRFNITETSRLWFNYSTNTRAPSASQLQDVIDNSNPLRLRGGNPDLRQQYSHSFRTRFNTTDRERGSSFFVNLSVTHTEDHISQRTYVAERDTLVQDGIILRAGSQLVIPENTGTSWNYRLFAARGIPLSSLKSNLHLNSGLSYSKVPVFMNEDLTQTNRYGLNAGFTLSSNISRDIDFRVNYMGSYQIVDQTDAITPGNNYYTGRAGASFNYVTGFGITFRTDWNLRHNHGLGDEFNRSTMYWNISTGYKFMRNDAAELKITAVDLLNGNDNINRIVTDDYIEDIQSDVLSRYFLLTLSYNFRSFPGGSRDRPQRSRR